MKADRISKIKRALPWLLTIGLLLAWQSAQAQIPISSEPATNAASMNDDLLLNATNNGRGSWTTKRITVGSLLQTALTNRFTNVALSGTFTGTLIGGAESAGLASWANGSLGLYDALFGNPVLIFTNDTIVAAPGISFSGNGSGLSNVPLSDLSIVSPTNNGVASSNAYARTYIRTGFRKAANRPLPMGIFWGMSLNGDELNPGNGYGATWGTDWAVGMSQYLKTNGYAAAGYNVVLLTAGTIHSNRTISGDLQLKTNFYAGNTFTNLVAQVGSNGCYLGVFLEFSSAARPVDEQQSATVIASTAYRDGFQLGAAGLRYIWMGDGNTVAGDPPTYEYVTEQFAQGLDDGVASIGGGHPVHLNFTSYDTPLPGHIRKVQSWMPDVVNSLYAQDGRDLYALTNGTEILDSLGRINAFRNWAYTDVCTLMYWPCSTETMEGAGMGIMTSNYTRSMFGVPCLASAQIILPMLGQPTAASWQYWTNPVALAIDQDALRSPAFTLSSNATLQTFYKPLYNGDLAVGMLNRDTNASHSCTVDFTKVPGLYWPYSFVSDAFDGIITNATTNLVSMVTTGGFNLYRLSRYNTPLLVSNPPVVAPAMTVNTGVCTTATSAAYVGFQFTVGSTPIQVTELGLYSVNGIASTRTVYLVKDSDKTVVVSASINATAANETWSWTSITPTNLTAGATYYCYALGADTFYNECAGGVTKAADISMVSSYCNGGWTNATTFNANRAYAGPGFIYTK